MLLPFESYTFSAKNYRVSDRRKSCGRPNILSWTFALRTSVALKGLPLVAHVICAGRISFLIITLVISALVFSSCSEPVIQELSREELFTLKLGKMEDQIDLFLYDGNLPNRKTSIFMRDGLFYIASGTSSKVMEFSSYGDLIFLLYNPERNPEPVSLIIKGDQEANSTRMAVSYPFINIGSLAVDSQKRIYIEDEIPAERQVKDKELDVILNRLIYRFDRHGKFIDFIGQEGVGGTPFCYIESIQLTEADELVVICRSIVKWLIFWFSSAGNLLYEVEIDQEHLPLPDEEAIPSLSKIFADLKDPVLHLMLYYYKEKIDEATKAKSTVGNFAAYIYRLNLETGRYEGYVAVPHNGERIERIGSREVSVDNPSYELIGLNNLGFYYLMRREGNNLFQLLLLTESGKVAVRRYLVMEDSDLYFKALNLSASGILYSLLGEEQEVKVVWWRSDRLAKGEEND